MVFTFNSYGLSRPEFLLSAVVLIILTEILLKKQFVKNREYLKKRRWVRVSLFITRSIIYVLLAISLANPFYEVSVSSGNVPKVKILIDNTTSMGVFDKTQYMQFVDTLSKGEMVADIDYIDTGDVSSIGDEILKKLEPDTNLLVVSDFNSNSGTPLEDVLLFASSLGSRVYGVNIKPEISDFGISLTGPSKVVSEVENTYVLNINRVGSKGDVDVKVTVDDTTVFEERVIGDTVEIPLRFSDGEHYIRAEILGKDDDAFLDNNVFFKVVRVIDPPRLLYVTRTADSPLLQEISNLYDVNVAHTLPTDLTEYYAVILNNIPADNLDDNDLDLLTDYLADENGLFVIGGKDSYEYGNYNSSFISNLIPVGLGKPKKKPDVTNIIIAIDTGSSSGQIIPGTDDVRFIDVQKALAVDIVEGIADNSYVGIIESNTNPHVIDYPSELGKKRAEITDKISRMTTHHATAIRKSAELAGELMKNRRGSKNLIIITDGNSNTETAEVNYYDQVESIKNVDILWWQGIRTYVVGVRHQTGTGTFFSTTGTIKRVSDFLNKLATTGHGQYFHAEDSNRLEILFGDPTDAGDVKPELFVYDMNHFITKDIDELGILFGFNSVYPKASAQMLVTTMSGDPILVVWHYGLGRVASYAADDGTKWSADLLGEEYSPLLIRSINWAIGEPERKNDVVVTVPDLILHETSTISVKSELPPVYEDLSFFEEKNNIFKAYYLPMERGFQPLMNMTVAVNYGDEYLKLGMNERASDILGLSDGSLLSLDPAGVIEAIQSSSSVHTTKTISIRWYFVLVAILIYLGELLLRRIAELKAARR